MLREKKKKRAVQKWEDKKFNKGRDGKWGREHGLGCKSSVLASGTRRNRVRGWLQSRPKKGPLHPPDHTLGNLFLQPTSPGCTLRPRFCTRLARLSEGYQMKLEA